MVKSSLCCTLSCIFFAAAAYAAPVHLRTNALSSPLGIDTPKPTFSWRSDATTPNWTQSAYEVLVDTEDKNLRAGHAQVWDSGKVASSESLGIRYLGGALKPQQRYVWRVITWDGNGQQSASAPAWFETGMMQASDWKAQWIKRKDPIAEKELSAVRWIWLPNADAMHVPSATPAHFRYEFHLDGKPSAASLHVLVRGDVVAHVNGQVTGHHDEWGAFDREEISSLLHEGKNEVELDVIAHRTGKAGAQWPAAVAAAVHITHADGEEERLVSGSTWQARSTEDGAWQAAQAVGPISMPFSIGTDRQEAIAGPDRVATAASLFRKDFVVDAQVRSARLTITALGAYHATINHQPVAPNTLLAPGWTDFHKRVQYQTYDVTSMVNHGANTIGVELGGGWYSSPLAWIGYRGTPGPNLVRAQLDITLANGEHKTIGTDTTWQTAAAPITFSEIYGGESYDARLVQKGWDAPHFDSARWTPAETATPPNSGIVISAQPDLPINTVMTLHPVHLDPANTAHPAVFDMGQNMVGNVRIHLRGPRGTVARLRYAERLNPDGSIYTTNLRNADATDTYALSGDGEETWTPEFTFHGFRYVELSFLGGKPAVEPTPATIEGLVFNSLPPAPSVRLTSSSELLNKMNELGAWGQRGNFFSIPTDCPQRDERLGWMGDAGVFWGTGSYNFDIDAFTSKFMLDVTDAQTAAGAFTDVSPNILGSNPGAPGWGDAGVFIPYAAWLQYGDTSVVERSWPAMQRWMEFILSNNPDYLRRKALGNNYADWLAPDQNTPRDLIGTAYWALVTKEMVEMAKALHKTDDAAKYQDQYDHIAAAYRAAFVKADGSVAGNTQTAYLATIFTGIAPSALLPNMVERVAKDVEAHGNHLTTGFLGTPFLMPVLDENGRTDLAFKLLLSDTYPSWGYMVKKGATTWWERWNGDTGDPSMNSYNHYAFGSVMAWVYRRAAGIDTDSAGPGFHHLTIQPHFDTALPKLHVEYDSTYGTVVSDWKQSEHRFTVSIPPNTTATVLLPGKTAETVGSGTHTYTVQ
jgi:alpha-L-rhamnosidase